ncbi:MAG: glycosyl transferase [Gammaproteobacteria bacterium]|nr:glycosyl transferase [Gammaproteobacteria bacterium]|tara:strand:+ start:87 stop:920 length:834 start_codon:yes stop_codon:yes gene_type:complete
MKFDNETDLPRISIVTPTFNSSEFFESTIKSIRSQEYRNFEWIVIDGGSTDNTINLIKENSDIISYWVSEPDTGMYDAIRKGFEIASGEIGYWLNSDDILLPWALQTVVNIFIRNPSCHWLTGFCTSMGTKNIPEPWLPIVFPQSILKRGYGHGKAWGFIQQESTFFNMNLYRKVGGINPSYKLAGDFDLWNKMACMVRLYTIRVELGCFRIHKNQLSSDMERYYEEVIEAGGKQFKLLRTIALLYSTVLYFVSRSKRTLFVGAIPHVDSNTTFDSF